MSEPFWNLTGGQRPPGIPLGLLRGVCGQEHHVYDDFYGPDECARCGYKDPRPEQPNAVMPQARFGSFVRDLLARRCSRKAES